MKKLMSIVLCFLMVTMLLPLAVAEETNEQDGLEEFEPKAATVWYWPTGGFTNNSGQTGYQLLTQAYKSGHLALDISKVNSRNIDIYATYAGTVLSAVSNGAYNGGQGNYVTIKHPNGYCSRYLHLNSVSVKAGDSVEMGQKIGTMGNTGESSGIHLHFDICTGTSWSNSNRVNNTPKYQDGVAITDDQIKNAVGSGDWDSTTFTNRTFSYTTQTEAGKYIAQCTWYPTHGTVKTTETAKLWNMPCSDSTNSAATSDASLSSGTTVTVIALYKNTKNNYWYKTIYNGKERYFYGRYATWTGWKGTDITLSGATNPSQIVQGNSFSIKGTVSSAYNRLTALYAYCYNGSATSGTPVISSSHTGLSTQSYSLSGSTLDNNLKFGNLSTGNYTYALKAKCTYYYATSGTSMTSAASSLYLVHSNTFSVVPKTTTVTVTFNANGGSASYSSKTVTVGSTYGDLPTATRTGYNFNGWFTAASGGSKVTSSTTVTTASNHTLYAHWTAKQYTVTFIDSGGSTISTKTVSYGSTYGALPSMSRTGYNFNGWFTASVGGSRVTESTTVTTAWDHTLYAQWSAKSYTVTLNANGGSVSPSSITVYYGYSYGYYNSLPTPTRSGYVFDGWYTSGGSRVTSYTAVTTASNHTLYAHWTSEQLPEFDGTIEWNDKILLYKGTTPYVVYNGSAFRPAFVVKDAKGNVVDAANYTYEYRENTNAGTGYVIVTFRNAYSGTARAWFKIYLPATTTTTVANVSNGIKITWSAVDGAAGYVIYRRAWSSTTNGWTDFVRWNNVTGTTWTDGSDDSHKVYAGTRYQYGVKAYFSRRLDPLTNTYIGGNVGDNYNLGEVGPLKTTVRITTRTLNSVTPGSKQLTVKWGGSSVFTGYQVQIATNESFTRGTKTVKITDPKTYETTIKSLKSGTTYYVRVRSYHVFEGMTYFGEWSNVRSCKVK